MRGRAAVVIFAAVFLFARVSSAHRIDEYLQATLLSVETGRIQASMRLIPGVLVAAQVIVAIDSNGGGIFSGGEKRAYAQRVVDDLSLAIDGSSVKPVIISWNFPEPAQMREGLGEIHLEYKADLPYRQQKRSLILTNRHLNSSSVYLANALVPQDPSIRILAQKRNERQSTYELDYQQIAPVDGNSRKPWDNVSAWLAGVQFSSLFRLGMHHIAEGTDHLLFLLVLLLPAPLVLTGRNWGGPAGVRPSLLRILSIVTAFTIGHSITLSLAALSAVNVPARPVEVLIAASILISAVHAYRPVFPGREEWIAAFFGLIHGMAFAAALDRLGMGHWDRIVGILAFNLGIEAMQMLAVVAILPSLMLLSTMRGYPIVRMGGAVFAGLVSAAWIVERLFDLSTPVDAIVNALARHALLIAATILAVSLGFRLLTRWRAQGRGLAPLVRLS
jgi:hypothetical protein